MNSIKLLDNIFHAAVVVEADRLETAIAACADVPALITVVESQDWPSVS